MFAIALDAKDAAAAVTTAQDAAYNGVQRLNQTLTDWANMFGEGYVCRTDTENEGGVDLKVGVIGRYVFRVHRDKEVFFLFCVNKLEHPVPDEVVEGDLMPCKLLQVVIAELGFSFLQYAPETRAL